MSKDEAYQIYAKWRKSTAAGSKYNFEFCAWFRKHGSWCRMNQFGDLFEVNANGACRVTPGKGRK